MSTLTANSALNTGVNDPLLLLIRDPVDPASIIPVQPDVIQHINPQSIICNNLQNTYHNHTQHAISPLIHTTLGRQALAESAAITNLAAAPLSNADAASSARKAEISKLRYVACGARIFLTFLTFLEILVNFVAVIPFFLLLVLFKSGTALSKKCFSSSEEADKAFENLKNIFSNFGSLIKNILLKSLKASKEILKPDANILSCANDLLNLITDVNGEIRNTLSVLGALGTISSALLGVTLGPLRIFQGTLTITLSVITLIKVSKELDKPDLLQTEKDELELRKKTAIAYLSVGILWIILGSAQVALTVLCPLGAPLWVTITNTALQFLLFDIGFMGMSVLYIKQSLHALNNYIYPIQTSINEIKTQLKEIEDLDKSIREEDPAKISLDEKQKLKSEKNNKLQKIREELKKISRLGQADPIHSDRIKDKRSEELLKRFFSDKILDDLNYIASIDEENLNSSYNLNKIKNTIDLMQDSLEADEVYHKWINIGLCFTTQMGISLSGTPWDCKSLTNPANPPYSHIVDATGSALWVAQNTLSKQIDDPGVSEALTGKATKQKEIKNTEAQRSIVKTYAIGLMIYMFGAFITADILGWPTLKS